MQRDAEGRDVGHKVVPVFAQWLWADRFPESTAAPSDYPKSVTLNDDEGRLVAQQLLRLFNSVQVLVEVAALVSVNAQFHCASTEILSGQLEV